METRSNEIESASLPAVSGLVNDELICVGFPKSCAYLISQNNPSITRFTKVVHEAAIAVVLSIKKDVIPLIFLLTRKEKRSFLYPSKEKITMNMKLSEYHVVTPSFLDERDKRVKRVIFATRTARLRIIDDAVWQILESGTFDLLPKDILFDFVGMELLVPPHENELKTILDRNHAAINDDDLLYLVIQPTAHCQLGCDYCGQLHSNKWLNSKHQDLFLERVCAKFRIREFRKLLICWFGAEPLSGLSVMRSFTPRLRTLCESFNCAYEAKIVTNGLALTDKVATELVNELSIKSIEITLDGSAEFHDVRRHRKNGTATF